MGTWRRGGLHVKGRKKRAKVCLAKNKAAKNSLGRKLEELQRTVPGSHQGMDVQTLFQSIQNYILQLEAKVTVLRCLSNLYGV